jgi:hypothetical protein
MHQDLKLKKAFEFLSSVNQKAYKDMYLLSNQILSKNPFTNDFIMKFFKHEAADASSFTKTFFKLLKYYLCSLKDFISYLVEFLACRLTNKGLPKDISGASLTIIDTFFILRKIIDENRYDDTYFKGLDNVLEKQGQPYMYLPVFDGQRKSYKFHKILRILKDSKKPILYEYQLLTIFDMFHILWFILAYPVHLLVFISSLKNDPYEERLLKAELLNTLDDTTYRGFSRYLQGRRIAELAYDKIKIISWYENQVFDKNLYKGLRRCQDKNRITIYGAQLLIYSPNILNIVPDESEARFGIIPDTILENGKGFIPEKTTLDYRVGPSFRYSKLFDFSANQVDRKDILILLPYYYDDVENILNTASRIKPMQGQILVKTHPATDLNVFKNLLPKHSILTNEDTYKLFKRSKIMISASSGTLLEAASLGIPAIYVQNPNRFDCNPLPDYGKGIIWQAVNTPEELLKQIDKFNVDLGKNYETIAAIALRYKEMFFCEPTEDNIIKSFDL